MCVMMINMKELINNIDFLDSDNWENTDYGMLYKKQNIKFIKLSKREFLGEALKLISAFGRDQKFGIICSNLSGKDFKVLKERKISYMSDSEGIRIFGSKQSKQKFFNDEMTSFPREFLVDVSSPTLLISPTGLEIVDTILKLSENMLYESPTELCRQFKLSRPKLSKIMNVLEAKNLRELKELILMSDIDWWIDSFSKAVTKRKMTPFRTKRTRRYAIDDDIDKDSFFALVEELRERGLDVELGGSSYLQFLRSLRSRELDLVVRSDHMIEIIESLQLRPAKKSQVDNCVYITPIDGSLDKERFRARIPNEFGPFGMLEDLNPLRYLWGLEGKESRVREERMNLLMRYFDAAKRRNDN